MKQKQNYRHKKQGCDCQGGWGVEGVDLESGVSSVQSLSCVPLFATPWTEARQASLSITNSWSSPKLRCIRWCHPAISSSVIPFSSCPQFLPASGFFQMSQLFTWGGQSIGVSASASVLPMNTQDWSPLGRTGWISLQSKGLSRVFSNTIFIKQKINKGLPYSTVNYTHYFVIIYKGKESEKECQECIYIYNWVTFLHTWN